MQTETIRLYENRNDVTLTSYILNNSPRLSGGKKRPAILICPGGGYLNCSEREAEPVAMRFAAMGYNAIVLRYSTYFKGEDRMVKPGEKLEINPDSVYPSSMRDIGKAFLYIHSRADEWFIDMNKIVLCGFSAGAHNCAMFAVNWNKPVIHEFFGESPELFKPAAAILGYGIYNYNIMMENKKNRKNPFAAALDNAANIAYFGTAEPEQKALDEASPALNITADTPPCFLWATSEDDLVPVVNSCEMAAALASASIPFEIHVYEKGPHGLALSDQASAESRMDLNAIASQWVGAAEKWLEHRFALSLRDKPAWMEMMEKKG